MLHRLLSRMRGLTSTARGTIVNDTGPIQTVQLTFDALETRDSVPVMQMYGFGSNAPSGTDYTTVAPSGDPANTIAIASNHQTSRHSGLNPGEVAIGLPGGARIVFTASGATITASQLTINAATSTFNGDLQATGAVIGGFGTANQVGLTTHHHVDGTPEPTPGT